MDADIGLFQGGPPHRLEGWLGLIKAGKPRVVRRALLAAAIAWVPLAVLTAMTGDFLREDPARSFALDFGVHARFLLATPLLILAEAICIPRLGAIARHFLDSGLVPGSERNRFDAAVSSTKGLRDSVAVEIAAVLLAYAVIVAIVSAEWDSRLPAWHVTTQGGAPTFSLAGWWGMLVSLPLLLVLLLGWLWRICLWIRFLWLVARSRLQIVAAHPDRAGGLMFAGDSVQAFAPLGLIAGIIVAGPVANRVVHQSAPLLDFVPYLAGVIIFVVVLFSGPLLVFAGRLIRERRRGIFRYGALADRMGAQFERKWLERAEPLDEKALELPDFSATTDLYQIVANVHAMRVVPLEVKSLVLLIGATLLPFVPVTLTAVPLDVIVEHITTLLL